MAPGPGDRARRLIAAVAVAAGVVTGSGRSSPAASAAVTQDATLTSDLDRIFAAPALSRASVAVRIQSLDNGRLLYAKSERARVIPASVMKIVTVAVAAERLGWDYRFETRLEAAGTISGGVLRGDLIVVGSGDPSITGNGPIGAPVFDDWADALKNAGISQVSGRIIGDDSAFDDEPLGAGWAWDYLSAGYAAPSGALSYNENVVVIRVTPGTAAGLAASVQIDPRGHGLVPDVAVTTAVSGSTASLTIARAPGTTQLVIRGQVPAGGPTVIRTTTVENPTAFFVEGLRLALASRGISATGGAWDIDDVTDAPTGVRRVIARRESLPLSSLAGYAMKVSQNYYGEMFLKAVGRRASGTTGSTERGRSGVMDTLAAWKIPGDALVMYDGSGLSRYNYVSADLLVDVLSHVWRNEQLRGPFVASLPVGGHDGTLEARMRTADLDRRVQAKTGTINNVRSLAGYADTMSGEKLVFAMIANNFTTPTAQVDAVMEEALARVLR